MRASFLGNGQVASGYGLNTTQTQSFAQLYRQLQQFWPDFLRMGDELRSVRSRYLSLARRASAAGNVQSSRAYNTAAARVSVMLQEHKQTVGKVNSYRDTWARIKSAIRSAGQWLGLGEMGAVVLAFSAVAAIAALAVVVNTYQQLKGQLAREKQILAALSQGEITQTQATEMVKAGIAPGRLAQFFGQFVGQPISWLVLAGGGFLLYQAMQRGSR